MRKISLMVLRAGSAALIMASPVVFGAAPGNAQTMGEYGTTVGDAGTAGESSSTLPPPAVYTNPVGGGSSGSTSTVEVKTEERRLDDSSDRDDHDAHDTNSGDDWSPAH